MARANESTKRFFFFTEIQNISKIYTKYIAEELTPQLECHAMARSQQLLTFWNRQLAVFNNNLKIVHSTCITLFTHTSNIRHVRYARASTVEAPRLCFSVG